MAEYRCVMDRDGQTDICDRTVHNMHRHHLMKRTQQKIVKLS